MLIIGKTIILLMIEIIIEYMFGTFLVKACTKRDGNILLNLLMGFMGYQALFQIVSLTFTLTTSILHHVTMVWVCLLFVTILMSVIFVKHIMAIQINKLFEQIKTYKNYALIVMFIVIVFCYYVSINGEHNDDAQYYIGLMTTSVGTDTLFKYNVYNGCPGEALYLRRALTTFEIHAAVISQISGIHPIIIARVFRASQNALLTSAAIFLCSNKLFWRKEEDAIQKSSLAVVVFWLLQLLFADTIYAPAYFLLNRAYEAKAFTANMIVLLGLYLCTWWIRVRDNKILLLIIVFVWSSLAIATSALMVVAAECMIFFVAFLLWRILGRKKRNVNAN